MKNHEHIILSELMPELERAMAKWPKHNSFHESFAILKEEVDELWSEIKKKDQNEAFIRREAIQVAAMAIRLINDCCKMVNADHA